MHNNSTIHADNSAIANLYMERYIDYDPYAPDFIHSKEYKDMREIRSAIIGLDNAKEVFFDMDLKDIARSSYDRLDKISKNAKKSLERTYPEFYDYGPKY
jgi:hypothetical protein